MQNLTITDYGVFLGKHSERLVVKKGKETVSEHPLLDLEEVTVAAKGVSLSTDLIAACAERGIPIHLLSWSGQPYALIVSPALTATVRTRREQLLAYQDERGVEIALRFAQGKVRNQINTVKYFAKYRKQRAPKKYAEIEERVKGMEKLLKEMVDGKGLMVDETGTAGAPTNPPPHQSTNLPPIDAIRPALLNLEGRAAALYWECVQRLLPEGKFAGREHRGAEDDVNALLNYGYGILYSQVWSALLRAGLEPFAGFLHADRPGKPSLVLDFIEEFRQPVVDRVVIASLNKGFVVEWETPEAEAARAAHQATADPRRSEPVDPRRSEPVDPRTATEAAAAAPQSTQSLAETGTAPSEIRNPKSEIRNREVEEQRRLTSETRRALAERIHERLAETERYERKQVQLQHVIQRQARHLATFLRREGEYKPFVVGW